MNNLRQSAAAALEALEEATTYTSSELWSPSMTRDCEDAITVLKQALAEPQTTHWEGCEAVHPECKEKNT